MGYSAMSNSLSLILLGSMAAISCESKLSLISQPNSLRKGAALRKSLVLRVRGGSFEKKSQADQLIRECGGMAMQKVTLGPDFATNRPAARYCSFIKISGVGSNC
jgi:hypothetical protein